MTGLAEAGLELGLVGVAPRGGEVLAGEIRGVVALGVGGLGVLFLLIFPITRHL